MQVFLTTTSAVGARSLMVLALADAVAAPGPRLCLLQRQEGESYGFRLRAERGRLGHIVRYVVPGAAAAHAGLRDGDRLLEVNRCYVNDLPHPEVDAITLKCPGRPSGAAHSL